MATGHEERGLVAGKEAARGGRKYTCFRLRERGAAAVAAQLAAPTPGPLISVVPRRTCSFRRSTARNFSHI
jgi:hypothetical protein